MNIVQNCSYPFSHLISYSVFHLLSLGALLSFTLFFKYRSRKNVFTVLAFIAVMVGSYLNLYERRYFGCVDDYFTVGFGLYFNIRDVLIVTGVLIITVDYLFDSFFGEPEDVRKKIENIKIK